MDQLTELLVNRTDPLAVLFNSNGRMARRLPKVADVVEQALNRDDATVEQFSTLPELLRNLAAWLDADRTLIEAIMEEREIRPRHVSAN